MFVCFWEEGGAPPKDVSICYVVVGQRRTHNTRFLRIYHDIFSSLDNCFRENKNRFLFSFLARLVELNVFLEVSINFLIKGHTGK